MRQAVVWSKNKDKLDKNDDTQNQFFANQHLKVISEAHKAHGNDVA